MVKKISMISIIFIAANKLIEIASVDNVKNHAILEKVVCDETNYELVSEMNCFVRPVAPNVHRVNITFHFIKPLDNLWTHFTVYYRYSTYQRLVHQMEDICVPNHNESKTSIMNVFLRNFAILGELTFVHKCPMQLMMFTSERMNMSHFVFPLMPAGRYRVDFNLTKGARNGRHIFFVQLFFKISDFRLWF